MSMISSYPPFHGSGPRHLRPEDDSPPTFMPPYQSGTPEEEEELALLQQLEQSQNDQRPARPTQPQRRTLEIRGQLSAQDQPPPAERPESEGQDELAGLLEPAAKPPRSERAAWFRDQLESAGRSKPADDELPTRLAQSQEQSQIPRRPHPTVDDFQAMPKSQLLKEAAPVESSAPPPLRPESAPQMEDGIGNARDYPGSQAMPGQTAPNGEVTQQTSSRPAGASVPQTAAVAQESVSQQSNSPAASRPKETPSAVTQGTPSFTAVNADAQQKSGSPNGGGAPRGLEYALKFAVGTLADGLANSVVGVLGGPGKHAYNPSPVRRAWGVDDMLPKIDREDYNRLQDGAEMLAFSLAGATNPRNRLQISIPAPIWRNEKDGTFLTKKDAARWLEEYRDKLLRTGSGEYQVGVEVEGQNNRLESRLVNGTVEFRITRQTSDGTMSGRDMFNSMMKFYGPAVKEVKGDWVYGDNLAKVNALTQSGTPLESAVKMTWTGLQAARHGFTQVEINYRGGENGKFTDIQVTYRKPPGS